MSRLKVYDSVAPDGQRGGTPHAHLLSTEMYYVLGGSGEVQMIDRDGFQRVRLAAGDALVFGPGTVHRLINPHGDLEILVLMANSGLPERGDNVVCFPEALLSDDDAYAEALQVTSLEDAARRRDLGVNGFVALLAHFSVSQDTGRAALERFYALAEARTRSQRRVWREMVESGPGGALAQAHGALDALEQQGTRYLLESQQVLLRPDGSDPALGFCGHLRRYFDPATLALEGIKDL